MQSQDRIQILHRKGYNSYMIKRELSQELKQVSIQYPVITITGPRQTGKTFLAKHFFKDFPYFNLEDLEQRDFALNDPKGFLAQMKNGGIIDEFQHAPNLSSYIQVIVDENREKKAQFILTGSQQFSLMKEVSQSLAGRTAVISLLPCSMRELKQSSTSSEVKDYKNRLRDKNFFLFQGFYPAVYKDKIPATKFYSNYIQTYLERDLNQITQIQDLSLFRKFLRACASRVGQVLNKESLASDLGIDGTTIKRWIDTLEASYILFKLEPYNANINKRLIKSPKIFFYDVGLASFLLGIENEQQISTHPLKGNLFENLVVIEHLKNRYNQGKSNNLNFYRDQTKEVDLILREANNFSAVEIKYAETIKTNLWESLDYLKKLFPEQCKERTLIYGGNTKQERTDLRILPFYEIGN